MKTILAVFLLSALTAFAQPYTNKTFRALVEWEASPDTNAVGYACYVSSNSFWAGSNIIFQWPTLARVDAGTNLSCIVSNLPINVLLYFVYTCYTSNLVESDYSPQLPYTYIKPSAPPHAPYPKVTLNLQASKSPKGPWGTVAEYDWLAETDPAPQFYRGLLTIQP